MHTSGVARRGRAWVLPMTAGVVAGVGSSLLLPRIAQHEDATGSASAAAVPRVSGAPMRALTSGKHGADDEKALSHERAARHEAAIAAHWFEPRDADWAGLAEAALWRGLLGAAGANEFSIVEVDCGAWTCIATLEWPSYTTALRTWRGLLQGDYEINCGREVLMPEPGPQQGLRPYRATIVFECQENAR